MQTITTTTGTVNTTDLKVLRCEDRRLDIGGGLHCYLKGWGVYNTRLGGWLTFATSVVTAGDHTARKPYLLNVKKYAQQVVDGGLNGDCEWLAL